MHSGKATDLLFCNEQLNKNVKCGKVNKVNKANIVLVIFKSFITFCWGKKEDKKNKSHIKSQSQYFGKKLQLDYFPKSFSPSSHTDVSCSESDGVVLYTKANSR